MTVGRKDRKKIYGVSNHDKQNHLAADKVKPNLPDFDELKKEMNQTSHTTISETNQGLGTTYSEFQLTQRPKWIKTQSQFIDDTVYDERKKSFSRLSKTTSSIGSRSGNFGNFSSTQTQQFLLPSITSNVDDHLSTFKEKHGKSAKIPNLNLIAKKLQTISLTDSQLNLSNESTDSINSTLKYKEHEVLHKLNQKLRKNIRAPDLDVNEQERLELTELQKLLDIKELQKFDDKNEIRLQFSRNFITSVDTSHMDKNQNLFEEIIFGNTATREKNKLSRKSISSHEASLLEPAKPMATLVPQKNQIWKNDNYMYDDLCSDDGTIANETLHTYHTLQNNVDLNNISFAPSRIKSLQLLENRAVALDDLCKSTAEKSQILSNKQDTVFNNNTLGIYQQNTSTVLNNSMSNSILYEDKRRPKTTSFAPSQSTLNPYKSTTELSRKNSVIMKSRNNSVLESSMTDNSQYYDDDGHGGGDYERTMSATASVSSVPAFKTSLRLLPQSTATPYISRHGVAFSKESPDYKSVSSLYNSNHGLSTSSLVEVSPHSNTIPHIYNSNIIHDVYNYAQSVESQPNNNRSSTASSILTPKLSYGDADTEYLKRKLLREARYNRTQETLEGMRKRDEEYGLKKQLIADSNARRKNNAIIRMETQVLVDNIISFSKMPGQIQSMKPNKKLSERMWSGSGKLTESIYANDGTPKFTTETKSNFTASQSFT